MTDKQLERLIKAHEKAKAALAEIVAVVGALKYDEDGIPAEYPTPKAVLSALKAARRAIQ